MKLFTWNELNNIWKQGICGKEEKIKQINSEKKWAHIQ